MKNLKLKTIDDFCEQPRGSFEQFIKSQEVLQDKFEQERKDRIKVFNGKKKT